MGPDYIIIKFQFYGTKFLPSLKSSQQPMSKLDLALEEDGSIKYNKR